MFISTHLIFNGFREMTYLTVREKTLPCLCQNIKNRRFVDLCMCICVYKYLYVLFITKSICIATKTILKDYPFHYLIQHYYFSHLIGENGCGKSIKGRGKFEFIVY